MADAEEASHPILLFLFPFHSRISIDQCINLNASWSKGYARKGAALHGARRYDDAVAAYEDGLKYEDSQALKKGLEEVRAAKGNSTFHAQRITIP